MDDSVQSKFQKLIPLVDDLTCYFQNSASQSIFGIQRSKWSHFKGVLEDFKTIRILHLQCHFSWHEKWKNRLFGQPLNQMIFGYFDGGEKIISKKVVEVECMIILLRYKQTKKEKKTHMKKYFLSKRIQWNFTRLLQNQCFISFAGKMTSKEAIFQLDALLRSII